MSKQSKKARFTYRQKRNKEMLRQIKAVRDTTAPCHRVVYVGAMRDDPVFREKGDTK